MSDRTLLHRCPHCLEWHDAVTTLEHEKPRRLRNGDIMFCFDCGEIAIFDGGVDGLARKPTVIEMCMAHSDPDVVAMKQAWAIAEEPE